MSEEQVAQDTGHATPTEAATGTILDPQAAPAVEASTGESKQVNFREMIPQEYRSEACLADINDMDSLVKSYIHAQKMVGIEKMPAPKEDWTPEQWNEHYEKLGRPGKPDEYRLPEVELPDELRPTDEQLAPFFEKIHEAGLNKKQADAVLEFYMNDIKEANAQHMAQVAAEQQQAQQQLSAEWGDKLNGKVQQALALVTQLGDDGLLDAINKAGLGRNAAFIKFLAAAAEPFAEDDPRSGGKTLVLGGPAKAQQEIDSLLMDSNFMKTYLDRDATGHKEAVAKMQQLHKIVSS